MCRAFGQGTVSLVDVVNVLELARSELLSLDQLDVGTFLPENLRLALQSGGSADHALVRQHVLVCSQPWQILRWLEPVLVVVGDRAAIQEIRLLLLVVLSRRR